MYIGLGGTFRNVFELSPGRMWAAFLLGRGSPTHIEEVIFSFWGED